MSSFLSQLQLSLDSLTGVKGSIGYIVILIAILFGYLWTSYSMFPPAHFEDSKETNVAKVEDEAEEPDPPRNFTLAQLVNFDGTHDEKSGSPKSVYLSINGIVFDVSSGRNFYGPGGPYEKFAGHECGVALAKMSFAPECLDDLAGCRNLNFGERTELDNWIEKFRDYRSYPVLGRLVVDLPDPSQLLTVLDLKKHVGSTDEAIPDGYAAAPIYIGAGNKVFDMSFGGVGFYGPGGPYHKFAGRNATRALALMSLDDKDLEISSTQDCTEKQLGVLNDWIKTFSERKGYPIVGQL